MESNLARPYGTQPSPPHDTRLTFWSGVADDLLFSKGKAIEITCRSGLRSVSLRWTVARNMFKTPFLEGTAEALPDNRYLIRIPANALKPGFFDLRVFLDPGDGEIVPGVCTFGYEVDDMPITKSRPGDFRKFWDKGLQELKDVPLAPTMGEVSVFDSSQIDAYNPKEAALPANYDPAGKRVDIVESCKVSFASAGGVRVHGWLAKPTGDGPFPAMLVLPGAGFAARPRPLEHARHGYLTLDIQAHGQEVDLTTYPRLPGYYDQFKYEPAEAFYYRRIYLNAVQALNYLLSRPDVDPSKVVVVGGSQGGRLSIVVAALDSRVAAAIPAIAHAGNSPYQIWYKNENSAVPPGDGMNLDAPPPLPNTPEGRCLGYYDTMSFAPDVKCPIFMNVGLIDPISDATGVFSIYNLLGSKDKKMIVLTGLGHDWSAEFDRRAWRWLDGILSLQKSPKPPRHP